MAPEIVIGYGCRVYLGLALSMLNASVSVAPDGWHLNNRHQNSRILKVVL